MWNSIYSAIKVRPLGRGWAVYVEGEPIIKPTSRHNANLVWSTLIKNPMALIAIALKAA